MLKSYFTMAWRSFRRNKVTSIINIGGLMLGLTTGIIICLLVVYTFGFDKFHANYKSIHLLEMNQNFAGTIYTGSWTPAPLGPVLQKEVPGLKYVVRAREEGQSLTAYGDKAIYQKGMYAEPDFFRMMTFPAIEGDPIATLREGSGIVLTESAARRLFGNGPAIGKTIPVLGKTILISCLGLFGLASFLVERRTKEISMGVVVAMPLAARPAARFIQFSGFLQDWQPLL